MISEDALPQSFHPLIKLWFREIYGRPTAVQKEAWALIEEGKHVLALAPTGSGKTLAAFLPAISRLCSGEINGGKLTVLYVSPLKALNEDIKRNLIEPIEALRARFENAEIPFPEIRVETRSGDTPQIQRRRFLASPPSVLALTPESLGILLLNPKGRQALSTVKYLILDEIHSVLGNKRGAFLSCQIDRLALTAGEFQRVSLSATIGRPEIAAEFLGGIGRKVNIVAPQTEKQIEFTIDYDPQTNICDSSNTTAENDRIVRYGKRYTAIINYVLNRISGGKTILIFTGSRRQAERLSYFINQEGAALAASFGGILAFAHHGSLAKELRQSVESRLAAGELPCVVATASLELGIDIGSIDEVLLAGSPDSASQALQRIGRSGHSVGDTSRGRIFPFNNMDLLQAAALKEAVMDRNIEELHPEENPLDILAYTILALCVEKNYDIDKLYELLKKFYVFRNLNHELYLRTVHMLAGLASSKTPEEIGRQREIKPRIWLDRINREIGALKGSLLLLYSSGGAIASRGLYSLRIPDGTKIGELDEEFVWERRAGDRFHFGGRSWRITGIDSESVHVAPHETGSDYIPFWKTDAVFRSPVLTNGVIKILGRFNDRKPITGDENTEAAQALGDFLSSQHNAQNGLPLPSSTGITVEIIEGSGSHEGFFNAAIHSFRGGAVNYPLTLAITGELEEMLNTRIESFSNDDALLFMIPRFAVMEDSDYAGSSQEHILRLTGSAGKIENIFLHVFSALNLPDQGGLSRGDRMFRNRFESSGVFGASFREAAEISLVLPKAGFGKRTPLWITRQRSKRLFDAVSGEDGFPITAEAWRSCLCSTFDMDGFRALLGAIAEGRIGLSFFRTSNPSPFSKDLVREEANALVYDYDQRKDMNGGTASLSDKVIEEALGSAALRPSISRELAESFTARLRREIPGWAPDNLISICEWVKERIAIPIDQWEILNAALEDQVKAELPLEFDKGRLVVIQRKGAAISSVVHREWLSAWNDEPLTLLNLWLRFEGPVSLPRITEIFGENSAAAENAIASLAEAGEVARDVDITYPANGNSVHSLLICNRENLEMLLRLSRRKARPEIKELPSPFLIPFFAIRQGLAGGNAEKDQANDSFDTNFLKKLIPYSAPAKLWETEFFPARHGNYLPGIIDQEISEGRLIWYGTGREKISFCEPGDLYLIFEDSAPKIELAKTNYSESFTQAINSGFFDRPRDFWEIKDAVSSFASVKFSPETSKTQTGINSKDCAEAIWQEAWQGRISSDSFDPVRRGIEGGFEFNSMGNKTLITPAASASFSPRRLRIPRSLRGLWKEGAPVRGRWFSLALDESAGNNDSDPFDKECRNRDRVRLLIQHWGLICRPLLEKISRRDGWNSPFSWQALLPALHRMELAGELVAGRFFSGINSLQFASTDIAGELSRLESFDGIYWMNAADPASPAGLEIEGLDPRIPSRLPSSRLYFRGADLIALSNRKGRDMQIFIAPSDPAVAVLIELFKIDTNRNVLPKNKIVIEYINGADAAAGEYSQSFKSSGFVPDRGKLCFWRIR